MAQFVQILGSLLVLAGFALAQQGRLDQKSLTYLVLNLLGSGVLAIEALVGQLWGFLLLEGVWALVSGIGLIQALRAVTPAAGSAQAPEYNESGRRRGRSSREVRR